MRTILFVAILLIIPHLTHGGIYNETMQVNGESSAATKMVERREAEERLKKESRQPQSQTAQEPSANTPRRPLPPLIPCPALQQSRSEKLEDLVKVETDSTTCTNDGEMKPENPVEVK